MSGIDWQPPRFFLSRDNSSHWYIIPVEHRGEWRVFADKDDDDETGWNPPYWATRIDGSPSNVTFEYPEDN